MNRTLPLFEGLEVPPADQPARRRLSRRAAVSVSARSSGPASGPVLEARPGGEAHLRAAWRLSRGMWRYPDHSPEQTRAGLAICRHLQALLGNSEETGRRG